MHSSRPGWYSRVARQLRTGPLSSRSRRQEAISEARETLHSLAELGNPQENGPTPETEPRTAVVKTEQLVSYQLLDGEHEAIAALERLASMEVVPGSVRRRKALPPERAFSRRRLEPTMAQAALPGISGVLARYATHLVLLIIASLVVMGGGFRALSVQAAHGQGSQQVDERYIGSDVGLNAVAVDPSLNTQSGYLSADPSLDTREAIVERPAAARVEAEPRRVITTYRAQDGDTVASMAQEFGISPDTILEANGIDDPAASLSPGQDLTILPVTGMLHKVQAGDTIESIARRYLADPRVIIAYKPNELKEPYQLKEGQLIVVPDGKRPPRDKIITHKVVPGETLSDIGLRFDISVDTIIWANNIDDPDSLRDGTELAILPITGFKHVAKAGETVWSIAVMHQVDPKAILDYEPNNLKADTELQEGQVVIVPDGKKPEPPRQVTSRGAERPGEGAPAQQQAAPEPQQAEDNTPTQATGQFVWPARGVITQYFSGAHNGIDIAAPLGTPVYAADAGVVTVAGWDPYGLGNHVRIDHGNGYLTIYGHFSKLLVHAGQYVERGQQIALMGSTGRSTGPHVHFIIARGARGYVNPLDLLP